MNRRSNKVVLCVEQLEDRWNPASLIWNHNPLFDPIWSNPNNWLNPATEAPPNAPPGVNDNILFTGVAKPCFLDTNATVNSLTIDPQLSSAETFVLHFGAQTLRIQPVVMLTNCFIFNAGTILFSNPVGHLVIDTCSTAEWSGEADFLGGTGTVELRNSTNLKVLGDGEKMGETIFVIGSPGDQVKSTLTIGTNTSGQLNLGHSGKINVTNKGLLAILNQQDFTINSIEENPHTIVLDGQLQKLGEGNTILNVGITMDAPTSELTLDEGTLIIDDPNQLSSVQQSKGYTVLKPGTVLDVRDGFHLLGGVFALIGQATGQSDDIFSTKGDFHFEGTVNLIQQLLNNRTIQWNNTDGEIIFGNENILVMNVGGGINQTDIIKGDQITLGGELRVNENVLVQSNMKLDLIGAQAGLMTGAFATTTVNGNPLEGLYEINWFLDQDNYRWFQIEKI